jgi:hypothetical protein
MLILNPIVLSKLEPTLGEAGEYIKIKGLKVTETQNSLPVVVEKNKV